MGKKKMLCAAARKVGGNKILKKNCQEGDVTGSKEPNHDEKYDPGGKVFRIF